MINYIDIKKAINTSLKDYFDFDIYSNTSKDDFNVPCFFTDLRTISHSATSKTTDRYNIRIRIFYYPQEKNDTLDMMNIAEELRQLFRLTFNVKDRSLNILESEVYLNTQNGFLEYTFRLDFLQRIDVEEFDKMESVEMNLNNMKYNIK